VPVLCVGNLIVGGAGKTPTVLALVERLIAKGHRPHILTRGYGDRAGGPLRVDPARHDARAVGDEALLLAEAAPTWVARDPVLGAYAAAGAGAGLVITDDGFQNPLLLQDLAFLVVDGAHGFGNRRLLPAGPLREPIADGIGRASAIIRIGADRVGLESLLPAELPRIAAELRLTAGAPELVGRRVLAFAGIGRPQKLFTTPIGAVAVLIERRVFLDHHRYRRAEIEWLLARAEHLGALCVTTTKDGVRLPGDLRARITALPVVVSWQTPKVLDRLLERAL
jgi:tetraacyldisaccharide 4'-kinase